MGWLYLPKIEPTAGQKGFMCGDVFVPIETEAPSAYKKGICIDLAEKDSAPTDGLVFHLSGETDSLTAETGQVFTKTGDSIVYTSNDGFPCWYTPSGQWMYSSDEGLPTGSSPWTQAVWVKCETNPSSESPVLSFGNLGSSRGGQALSFVNKTAIRSVGGVGQDFTTDINVIDPLIWNHVAITYDGSTITIYVNGEAVKSGSHSKSIRLYGSNGLGIGGCRWEDPFQGWIRNVRIYNRALSPDEVRKCMIEKKRAFIPLEEVQPVEGAEYEKNSEEMPSEGLILHVPLAQSVTADELGNELSELGNVVFTTVDGIQCADISDTSALGGTRIVIKAPALSASGPVPVSFSFWVAAYEIPSYKNEFFYYGRRNENDFPDYKSMFVEITKYNRFSTNFGESSLEAYPGFHHIAYMCTGTKTLFYVDGVLQYSDNRVWDYGGNTPIYISGGYFAGFRMYNRALSESEVRTLAREWKKPVPDAPIGTGGILISSSNTIFAGKFNKNESAEIPSSGLLLHASLEQDSETAETGQTFTKGGNVTFETVQGMKCAYFDGNSYWQVPFESDLAGNTAKAVSLWMRGTKNTANGSWQEAAVVAFGYWVSGQAFAIEHLSSSTLSNQIYGKIYGGGDVTTYDNSAIEDFHHVVFQYDTEKTQLFIDGEIVGSSTYSSLNTSRNYPITIGWNAMSADIKFTGYISGVRIYNRALSELEIQNLSNEWQRAGRTNKIFIPVLENTQISGGN